MCSNPPVVFVLLRLAWIHIHLITRAETSWAVTTSYQSIYRHDCRHFHICGYVMHNKDIKFQMYFGWDGNFFVSTVLIKYIIA